MRFLVVSVSFRRFLVSLAELVTNHPVGRTDQVFRMRLPNLLPRSTPV